MSGKTSWWPFLLAALAIALFRGTDMAFAVKPGVFGRLQPQMDPVLPAVSAVWNIHGLEVPMITSIEDGTHMPGSKHYEGLAVDIRLHDIPQPLHETLRAEVAAVIGSGFDVVHEYHGTANDHLHIEYDPS